MLSAEELDLISKVLDAVDSLPQSQVERVVNDPLRFSLFRETIASFITPLRLPARNSNDEGADSNYNPHAVLRAAEVRENIVAPDENAASNVVSDLRDAYEGNETSEQPSTSPRVEERSIPIDHDQSQTAIDDGLLRTDANQASSSRNRLSGTSASRSASNPCTSSFPQDASVFLQNTTISTATHKVSSQLRSLCTNPPNPNPFNNLALVTRNHGNKKVGQATYRIIHLDLEDERATTLIVHKESDLYLVDDKHNPYAKGTVVNLKSVLGVVRAGKPGLVYAKESKVSKVEGVMWEDVLRWHRLVERFE